MDTPPRLPLQRTPTVEPHLLTEQLLPPTALLQLLTDLCLSKTDRLLMEEHRHIHRTSRPSRLPMEPRQLAATQTRVAAILTLEAHQVAIRILAMAIPPLETAAAEPVTVASRRLRGAVVMAAVRKAPHHQHKRRPTKPRQLRPLRTPRPPKPLNRLRRD